jgi:hypothetical protein
LEVVRNSSYGLPTIPDRVCCLSSVESLPNVHADAHKNPIAVCQGSQDVHEKVNSPDHPSLFFPVFLHRKLCYGNVAQVAPESLLSERLFPNWTNSALTRRTQLFLR